MSTQRLYYDDSFQREFTANVLSCEAAPIDQSSRWHVILDRTGFYPASGGQPHDTGQLGTANVVEVHEVLTPERAAHDVDGAQNVRDEYIAEVIHVVDRPVDVGPITGRIDWERRFDHMQQHSGQHLLSAVFQNHFGLATVSFHLGSEISTIDLRGGEPSEETLADAASAANQIIYDDRSLRVIYGTADQLAQSGVRKEVKRTGVLRAIEIDALDLQPCGGTHVRSTGQIGMILLRGVSKIRQDWRLEFACGRRAERLARQDFITLKAVTQKLNCAPSEAVSAAERLLADRDAHFKSARASLLKLAAIDAAAAVQATPSGADGVRVMTRLFQNDQPEYVRAFASEAAKSERTVALVARTACGHVFFMQHPLAGKDMNALLQSALKKLGGKGGGSRDSARGRLADPQRAQELLAFALAELTPPK
jgi:alanyl-tRNA synthetase